MPIKYTGKTVVNRINGDYTVEDYSYHETNINSNNMYGNVVTDSYNNYRKSSEQFQYILIHGRLMTRFRCFCP